MIKRTLSCTALLLAACGGGGSDGTPATSVTAPTSAPVSASASGSASAPGAAPASGNAATPSQDTTASPTPTNPAQAPATQPSTAPATNAPVAGSASNPIPISAISREVFATALSQAWTGTLQSSGGQKLELTLTPANGGLSRTVTTTVDGNSYSDRSAFGWSASDTALNFAATAVRGELHLAIKTGSGSVTTPTIDVTSSDGNVLADYEHVGDMMQLRLFLGVMDGDGQTNRWRLCTGDSALSASGNGNRLVTCTYHDATGAILGATAARTNFGPDSSPVIVYR